jgi:hypothetical protein
MAKAYVSTKNVGKYQLKVTNIDVRKTSGTRGLHDGDNTVRDLYDFYVTFERKGKEYTISCFKWADHNYFISLSDIHQGGKNRNRTMWKSQQKILEAIVPAIVKKMESENKWRLFWATQNTEEV